MFGCVGCICMYVKSTFRVSNPMFCYINGVFRELCHKYAMNIIQVSSLYNYSQLIMIFTNVISYLHQASILFITGLKLPITSGFCELPQFLTYHFCSYALYISQNITRVPKNTYPVRTEHVAITAHSVQLLVFCTAHACLRT